MKRLLATFQAAYSEWLRDRASRLAAAMAFYAIFALPALALLALSVASLIFERGAARQQLLNAIQNLAGAQAAESIGEWMANVRRPSDNWLTTTVGLVLLFISASAIFGQLQDALNTIWGVRAMGGGLKRVLLNRGLTFLMVIGVGVLLIILLLMTTTVSLLIQSLPPYLRDSLVVAQLVDVLGTFVLATLGFAVIYKVVPDVRMAWHHVFLGASVTAALFTLGKFALSLYLQRSDPTSAYGAAGSLILLLLWVYYSAQIFFFGAEFTQVWAHRTGEPIRPSPNAVSDMAGRLTQDEAGQRTVVPPPTPVGLVGAPIEERTVHTPAVQRPQPSPQTPDRAKYVTSALHVIGGVFAMAWILERVVALGRGGHAGRPRIQAPSKRVDGDATAHTQRPNPHV